MDDIDWMDVKEKDDTIRELRQKLAEANQRIAELEAEVEYMEELYVLEHDTEPPKQKELSDV